MTKVMWSPLTGIMHNMPPGSLIVGVPGAGKSMVNNSPVLTENGWKPIESIEVGDKVYTPKGTLSKVVSVHPQGDLPTYTITTNANQSCECSGDHLWGIYNRKGRYKVRTTEEMVSSGIKTKYNRAIFSLPVSSPILFSEKELPVHPYILGAFIGDGCCTEPHLAISSSDEPVVSKIAAIINAKRYEQAKSSFSWSFYRDGSNKRFQRDEILHDVPEIICYSNQKRVPSIYKLSSIEQRWELIQGLFDTDGSCNPKNGRKGDIRYDTTSKQLAEDIVEILFSLGVESTIRTQDRRGSKHIVDNVKYTRKSVEYTVVVHCSIELYSKFFTLPRKLDKVRECVARYKPKKSNRRYDRIGIKSIEPTGKSKPCTCITIQDPDGLFITKDYIVTHNSFSLLNFAANTLEQGARIFCLDAKNDLLPLQRIYPDIHVIDVNKVAPGSLDPFLVFGNDIDTSTLLTVTETMTTELSPEQKLAVTPIINDFVNKTKMNGAGDVSFAKFADYLFANQNVYAQQVGNMLKMNEDSKYGPLIFGRVGKKSKKLTIDSKQNTIISILGMALPSGSSKPKPDELVNATIIYIICKMLKDMLTNRSKGDKTPTLLVLDECHQLFRSQSLLDIVDELLVLGRSLNISILLGSQNVTHFPDDIAQFVSTKICFRLSKKEAAEFLDMFDTSTSSAALDRGELLDIIPRLRTGHCLMIDRKGRGGLLHIESQYGDDISSNPLLRK